MNNFNLRKNHIAILVTIILLFSGCSDVNSTPVFLNGFYFDTIISITVYDDNDAESVNTILNDCMELCSYYENIFSKTKECSEIYKINNSNTTPVNVSDELIELLTISIELAKLSDGEVDPTIGSLSELWNIGKDNFAIPSEEGVKEALSHVNYQNIIIDHVAKSVTLTDPKSKLDLGFIAKGYIADKLKDYLISKNIKSAIINLGGNILTIGDKNGEPFKIGIRNPLTSDSNSYIKSLDIRDKSIVSSGNYERFSEVNGQRYHHILSTKTGYPCDTSLSQVTIISKDSVTGDKLSTLCFILGYEDAQEFLKDYYPDVTAIFVNTSGQIIEK